MSESEPNDTERIDSWREGGLFQFEDVDCDSAFALLQYSKTFLILRV